MYDDLSIEHFMKGLIKRNPHETEFHQAVREVAESVIPYIIENPRYRQAGIIQRMTEPDRTIIFRVVWEDDEGNIRVNRGFRVQFNNSIGPYKGGLRFDPSVTLSVLKFLAFEQTFKNSLTGLPIGSGKGGSDFNPKGKSDQEVMRFCQSFMTELFHHIGPHTDIPAGDIGVGNREISYMFGQYKRLAHEFTGVLTGKSLEYGGSHIRSEATGYGNAYFMQEMLKHHNESMEGKVCAVSGAGNVALHCARKINALGGKVVTLSDSSGFIYDPEGINEEKLDYVTELKTVKRGRISEYADRYDCDYYPDKRPWSVDCDLAFPCATQNELDVKDAKALIKNGCMAISEGANMPTTVDAMHRLQDAGVIFGPGKAANAGGVAISGLEMSQNSMRLSWSAEEVENRLKIIMRDIHDKCVEHGRDGDRVDYVKGANIAGFIKVADAMLAYGVS
ncbi:NADP-specific glutamate dehydrogenase [Seongchinamella unica]|uniref:Glutamate dehydrogenase n=1 Tax=Seongchinamella unica TaxID=2547392 RepID=A0A4R5LX02_9GAMM|nr:NADP-specific glutamate dehydrogenase [Seongchinamella unica]TDG15957.1 NADP-specific glutamate dehydrogenase [Seongchinamella unica]